MKIEFTEYYLIATREPEDPKYYGTIHGKGESLLLHAIKKKLQEMGHDVIKKRMWKDGHMVDDLQQYLRTRKGYEPSFAAYSGEWAIRGANVPWNEDGVVQLQLVTDLWKTG